MGQTFTVKIRQTLDLFIVQGNYLFSLRRTFEIYELSGFVTVRHSEYRMYWIERRTIVLYLKRQITATVVLFISQYVKNYETMALNLNEMI